MPWTVIGTGPIRSGIGLILVALATLTPTRSVRGDDQATQAVRSSWARLLQRLEAAVAREPDSFSELPTIAPDDPNLPAWRDSVARLIEQLDRQRDARTLSERLNALARLDRMAHELRSIVWSELDQPRRQLAIWLEPRVQLARAVVRLTQALQPPDPGAAPLAFDPGHAASWNRFLETDLFRVWSLQETPPTIDPRIEGDERRRAALTQARLRVAQAAALIARDLEDSVNQYAWPPAIALLEAWREAYYAQTIRIRADLDTTRPLFDQLLVRDGPIVRKGRVSYITAGPKLGYTLLPSPNAIAFANTQALTSVTPVLDFRDQVARDIRGRLLVSLYEPSMTTYDQSILTIFTAFSTNGLALDGRSQHCTDIAVGLQPQPCTGLRRAALAAIGFDAERIRSLIYQNAIGEVRRQVPIEAREERSERLAQQMAKRNANLRRFLVGDRRLRLDEALGVPLGLDHLSPSTQSDFASITAQFRWGDPLPLGTSWPLPADLRTNEPGLVVDLHAPSILNTLSQGVIDRLRQRAPNRVLVNFDTLDLKEVNQPKTFTYDPDDNAWKQALEDWRRRIEAGADPKTAPVGLTLLIDTPKTPPIVTVDAEGQLVLILRNLRLRIPPLDDFKRIAGDQAEEVIVEAAQVTITFRLGFGTETVLPAVENETAPATTPPTPPDALIPNPDDEPRIGDIPNPDDLPGLDNLPKDPADAASPPLAQRNDRPQPYRGPALRLVIARVLLSQPAITPIINGTPGQTISGQRTTFFFNTFLNPVIQQEFAFPLETLAFPGFALESLRLPDESGWIRARFRATGERPLPQDD